MGKKKSKLKPKPKPISKPQPCTRESTYSPIANVSEGSMPGCHIAFLNSPWIFGIEDFVYEDWFDDDDDDRDRDTKAAQLPEISIDPQTNLLTCINTSSEYKSYFITVYNKHVVAKNKKTLEPGMSRDDDGKDRSCVTLVLLLRPRCVMDVAYLKSMQAGPSARMQSSEQQVELYSDVRTVSMPTAESQYQVEVEQTAVLASERYCFPLRCSCRECKAPFPGAIQPENEADAVASQLQQTSISQSSRHQDSFLCTQSPGGCFTHFYPYTYHAIDLQAEVGTDVLASQDGEVYSIQHSHSNFGIDIRFLFSWNSVVLKLDNGNFVEYVHIKKESVMHAVGHRVKKGEKICESGNVGFCPIPHLHIQMHASSNEEACTIPLSFYSAKRGQTFVPRAGYRYHLDGEEVA